MDDYLMSWETCQAHAGELNCLYGRCADELSRQNLLKDLQGRLTGRDVDASPSGWTDPQHFFPELIDWREEECLMDGGAYIGDTVEEFFQKKPDSVLKYRVYAWEPDAGNIDKERDRVSENGDIAVPVSTIDLAAGEDRVPER